MKNEGLRVIPKKNYVILGIVILLTICLVYYFYTWSRLYNEVKLNERILDNYMEVINYNELEDYLIENPDTVIYVSVLKNSTIRDFEKKFRRVLKNNEIDKKILYLDLTNDIDNKNLKNEMKKKYHINNLDITDVPLIMIIENGTLKTIYSIRYNDYDIGLVKNFLNSIEFEEDEIDG